MFRRRRRREREANARRTWPNTDLLAAVNDHYRIAESRARALGVWAAGPDGDLVIWPPNGRGRWSGWRSMQLASAAGAVRTRDVPDLLKPQGGTIAGNTGMTSIADSAASLAALPITDPDDDR